MSVDIAVFYSDIGHAKKVASIVECNYCSVTPTTLFRKGEQMEGAWLCVNVQEPSRDALTKWLEDHHQWVRPIFGWSGVSARPAAPAVHKRRRDSEASQAPTRTERAHRAAHHPFPHAVIESCVDAGLLEQVYGDIISAVDISNVISNDLYCLSQSVDLPSIAESLPESLQTLISTIYCDETIDTLIDLFNIDPGEIDRSIRRCSLSLYRHNDFLLCHDDQMDDRVIAWILYLSDIEWTPEDGGSLRLYNCDDNDDPIQDDYIEHLPNYNRFMCFPVTSQSWHEVTLMNVDKPRVALSGWFYRSAATSAPEAPVTARQGMRLPPLLAVRQNTGAQDWISPIYQSGEALGELQEHFADQGCLLLSDFLSRGISTGQGSTQAMGPLYRQRYTSRQLDCCQELPLLQPHFLEWVARITNLQLDLSAMRGSLRSFKKGDYTLLSDDHPYTEIEGIFITYYLDGGEEQDEEGEDVDFGGDYIFTDETEPLLTVSPSTNSISIVYKEAGVQTFVSLRKDLSPVHQIDLIIPIINAD